MTIGLLSNSAHNEINECISELRFRSPGITDIAVVSIEGLPIASSVMGDADDNRLSAMTAASVSLGERVVMELNKGDVQRILIEGNLGYIITMEAGPNAVITVSTTKDAKLGLLFLDIERSAKKIEQILSI